MVYDGDGLAGGGGDFIILAFEVDGLVVVDPRPLFTGVVCLSLCLCLDGPGLINTNFQLGIYDCPAPNASAVAPHRVVHVPAELARVGSMASLPSALSLPVSALPLFPGTPNNDCCMHGWRPMRVRRIEVFKAVGVDVARSGVGWE